MHISIITDSRVIICCILGNSEFDQKGVSKKRKKQSIRFSVCPDECLHLGLLLPLLPAYNYVDKSIRLLRGTDSIILGESQYSAGIYIHK